MESLTLEDMDTYTSISRKIQKADIFSLVDTYFMPYGVECDQYSVLGEITDMKLVTNGLTGEKVHILTLCCNDLNLKVATCCRTPLQGQRVVAGTGEFPGRVVEEFTDSVKYLTCTDNFCIINLFMELFFV